MSFAPKEGARRIDTASARHLYFWTYACPGRERSERGMPKIRRMLFVPKQETRADEKGEKPFLFLFVLACGIWEGRHAVMQIHGLTGRSKYIFPCLQTPFFSGMGVIKIKIKSKGNLFGQFAANEKKEGACPYKKLN